MLTFTQYLLADRLDKSRRRLALEMAKQDIDPRMLLKEGLVSAFGRAWQAFWNAEHQPKTPQDYQAAITNKAAEYDNLLRTYISVIQQQSGDNNIEPVVKHIEELYQKVKGGIDQVDQSIGQINDDIQGFAGYDKHVQELRQQFTSLNDDIRQAIQLGEGEEGKQTIIALHQRLIQFFDQVATLAKGSENAALQQEAQEIMKSLRAPEFIWLGKLMRKFQPQQAPEPPPNTDAGIVDDGKAIVDGKFTLPDTVKTIEELAKFVQGRIGYLRYVILWANKNNVKWEDVAKQVQQINGA